MPRTKKTAEAERTPSNAAEEQRAAEVTEAAAQDGGSGESETPVRRKRAGRPRKKAAAEEVPAAGADGATAAPKTKAARKRKTASEKAAETGAEAVKTPEAPETPAAAEATETPTAKKLARKRTTAAKKKPASEEAVKEDAAKEAGGAEEVPEVKKSARTRTTARKTSSASTEKKTTGKKTTGKRAASKKAASETTEREQKAAVAAETSAAGETTGASPDTGAPSPAEPAAQTAPANTEKAAPPAAANTEKPVPVPEASSAGRTRPDAAASGSAGKDAEQNDPDAAAKALQRAVAEALKKAEATAADPHRKNTSSAQNAQRNARGSSSSAANGHAQNGNGSARGSKPRAHRVAWQKSSDAYSPGYSMVRTNSRPNGKNGGRTAQASADTGQRMESVPERTFVRPPRGVKNANAEEPVRNRNQNYRQDPYQNQNPNPARDESPNGNPAPGLNEAANQAPNQNPNPNRPEVTGILDIAEGGFGFLRFDNFLTSDKDVYVSPTQIRRFNLKTGDEIQGISRLPSGNDRFGALLYVSKVNGDDPGVALRRPNFSDLTPIFPSRRLTLEDDPRDLSTRLVDLIAPLGLGQRGLIVAPPKAGKTTLLKSIAHSIEDLYPDVKLIVLLVDERPEEVTDMERYLRGSDVIYSTFDEMPNHHVKVAEMVLERARRLAEHGRDVVILLDSLTRLTRAYNLVVPASGRTLSGGIDPAAFYGPKRFFGAARNIEEGGSVTILATALVDTGSRMDDVIYEEFKGTGNMELHLDRHMSEKRIFPAIDIYKSGTRREELLLSQEELEATYTMRRAMANRPPQEVTEEIIDNLAHTRNNKDFIDIIRRLL